MSRNRLLVMMFAAFVVIAGMQMPLIAQQQPTKKQFEQARKFALEGDKAFRQKNYRKAITEYQKATAIAANFPAAHYFKGYAHYYLNEFDAAVESFTAALTHQYSPLEVYKVRWFSYYKAKNLDSALADLEQLLKLQPQEASHWTSAGDLYREKGMVKEAVAAYEQAVTLNPNSGDLFYSLAFTYALMGDRVQQGVTALKAIQKTTRFLGDSWYLVGVSFQSQRKYPEAADAFERAISAKPDIREAYLNLSQIYQVQNRFEDAIATIKKGLEVAPENGDLYVTLTWLYSLTDRNVDAIIAGRKAVSLVPEQYMAYTNLCRAYNDAKQYDQAIQACNSALKLQPGDGESNFYLARAYDFQKKPDVATGFYTKAVKGLVEFTEQNPDYSDGFYLLGNAYFAVGQRTSAIAAYRKSLALSPKFTKAIFNLGYMYHLNGDRNAAREQYDSLLKLDPELAAKLLDTINGK